MLLHEKAIKQLGRYMYHTKREGIVYNPDITKGLEFYIDADFAGGWKQTDSHEPDNVLSRTGMVIMYANCPIFWRSILQTEIASGHHYNICGLVLVELCGLVHIPWR